MVEIHLSFTRLVILKEGLFCERTFLLKNLVHNSSRLEYNVGMLRSNKDSLYDNDGLIIFNALDCIANTSKFTQQCNVVPYFYAVYWLRPASSAFSLARKCNWLAGIMVIRCVTRRARRHKLQSSIQVDLPSIPHTVTVYHHGKCFYNVAHFRGYAFEFRAAGNFPC